MPKVAVRLSAVITWSSSPGGDDTAVAHQHGVGEAGRDLLDVVGDQHQRRRVRVGGELGEPGDDVNRPPRSSPAAGSSSSISSGIGHQGAGDLHPLALALRQRAEGPPAPARPP